MHEHTRTHLEQIKRQIHGFNKFAIRRDLHKMWKNCESVYQQLDRESVRCRRLNSVTADYCTIKSQLDDMIKTLEKRMTWAQFL
jgi:predicted phage-related endonuclease